MSIATGLPRSQSSLDRAQMETIGEEDRGGDSSTAPLQHNGRGSSAGRGGARTKIATPVSARKTYPNRRH